MGRKKPRPEPEEPVDYQQIAVELYKRGLISRVAAFGHHSNWRDLDYYHRGSND